MSASRAPLLPPNPTLCGVRPRVTISRTVKAKSVGCSWRTAATLRAAERAVIFQISVPPISTVPLVGL